MFLKRNGLQNGPTLTETKTSEIRLRDYSFKAL